MNTLVSEFWHLWLDAAPWLILGLIVAGLMQALIPSGQLARHLGGEGIWPAVKAALLGAPLPLCSCGVIPAAVGLRRAGASRGATSSFLIATPETGVDSIAISYALLGPFLAVMRPVAAVVTAVTAGALTAFTREPSPTSAPRQPASPAPPTSSCCASKPASPAADVSAYTADCCSPPAMATTGCGSVPDGSTAAPRAASCCSPRDAGTSPAQRETGCGSSGSTSCSGAQPSSPPVDGKQASLRRRLVAGQKTAFNDLFGDLVNWLLVGLLFAALVVAYVPEDFLTRFSEGLPAMLIMALIGVPMYICASASTPVAAGLLLAGVSPGAVLVFMLAGPATNIATLGIVRRELGGAALAIYLGSVIGVSIGFGYLTNALVTAWGVNIRGEIAASAEILPGWLSLLAAIVLAAMCAVWYVRQWQRRRQARCCS
ncbi:SO_0444 family Cu/Zn efflux transporter [Halomonas sp. WWR20]